MSTLKSFLMIGLLSINTTSLIAEDDFGKQLAENEKQFEEFLENVGNIGNVVAKQEYGIDMKAEIQAPQDESEKKIIS